MLIGGLQRFSLIDYPGELCAVVFTIGCNFRCPYCHNPELVNATAAQVATPKLLDFLSQRKGKLTAVTITGGEPTLQSDLKEFLIELKKLGYKTKLDTNGTKPDVIGDLIEAGAVDYIAMDVKAPLEKYPQIVNVPCDTAKIQQSIQTIKKSDLDYEFRTTLVRELLSLQDVENIATMLAPAKAYCLQRFTATKTLDPTYMNATTFTPDELNTLKHDLSDLFERLVIR